MNENTLAGDLIEITTYRKTPKVSRLRFTDTGELIVEWPNAIAPKSHAEACEQAVALARREKGGAS